MHVKPIIKPPVSETFFYGKIISWKFSDSVTYVKARKKYCFRFEIVFESGKVCPMQRGGFVSKTEAIKEIYVNTERVVYNADCEILAFALEVLPKNNAAQLIPLDERYLLEVLP